MPQISYFAFTSKKRCAVKTAERSHVCRGSFSVVAFPIFWLRQTSIHFYCYISPSHFLCLDHSKISSPTVSYKGTKVRKSAESLVYPSFASIFLPSLFFPNTRPSFQRSTTPPDTRNKTPTLNRFHFFLS